MSETTYGSGQGSKLARVGGALGIAGTMIGVAIFLAGCAGIYAAFALSLISFALGAIGIVLSVIGAVVRKDPSIEDTHVLAAILINVGVMSGALLEFMIWKGWPMFFGGAN